MKRNIATLDSTEYDLIIVGGGIFAACAAWEAVLRGLSVALVEKGDFAYATSSNHFKMIHGGIRYLQHADFYRMRQSIIERRSFLRIAPHLIQPLPIVIPTYGHGMKGKEILGVALLIYDTIACDRNRGINDATRQIPPGRLISRDEVLALFPDINKNGLTGAAIFSDGQMYNPPRLTLSFLKSAVEAGADIANYVEATGFVRSGNCVTGVTARDMLSGDEFIIRGKIVLNATGPWAAQLLEKGVGIKLDPSPTFSRDACFVISRQLHKKYALTLPAKTKDPDALLSRDARHLFIVPWRDYTLVGVWHVVHDREPEAFAVTESDLQNFMSEINDAYPSLSLKIKDVSKWNAGLTLFGSNKPGAVDLSYGKRSKLIDHSKVHGVDGLVTLIGVRLTTAMSEACRTLDLLIKKLGKRVLPSTIHSTPISGGNIDNFNTLLHEATKQFPPQVSSDIVQCLLHNYGSTYRNILKYIAADPAMSATIDNTKVTKAEIVHAIQEEMAIKLGDIVFRRTDLAVAQYPRETGLKTCAELAAPLLEWNDLRVKQELDEVKSAFYSNGLQK